MTLTIEHRNGTRTRILRAYWTVPGTKAGTAWTIELDADKIPHCNCPQATIKRVNCKHQINAELGVYGKPRVIAHALPPLRIAGEGFGFLAPDQP